MRRERDILGRLYVLYAEANNRHFGGLLPYVAIDIETIAPGRRVDTVAYCLTDDHTGRAVRIVFDGRYVQRASWGELRDTLLHEVVHVWQAARGLGGVHDASFRAMAKRLGCIPRAS